ncbi:hypothetical protein LIER_37621 [Lithospermum erythrorhizon]|uniref:U4/U6.U5 small nuclear ribonucleoprotein 27kDa protein domain-containing protein n=1 Tax=Lithospermum erythrorhizon TaxID=34254 RepID=A0AAV3PSA7_LITER
MSGRDRDRDRDRNRDKDRDRKRDRDDRDRKDLRHRNPDRHHRDRRRSRRSPTPPTDSPPRKRHHKDSLEETTKQPKDKQKDNNNNTINNKTKKKDEIEGGNGDGEFGELMDEEEMAMMKQLGIPVGFDSTKGKAVAGNDVGAVRKVTKRQPRQYMNRRGGFNRPLPAEVNR